MRAVTPADLHASPVFLSEGRPHGLEALSRPLSRTSKFVSRLEHIPVTTFGKADRKMALTPISEASRPKDDERSRSATPSASAAAASRPVSCSAWAASATHVLSTGNRAADEYLAARPWAARPVPDAVDYTLLLRGKPNNPQQAKEEATPSEAASSVISRQYDRLEGWKRAPSPWEVAAAERLKRASCRKAAIIYKALDHQQWNGPRCHDNDGKPVSTFGAGRPMAVPVSLAGPGAYNINLDDVGDVPRVEATTLRSAARGPVIITRSGLVGNVGTGAAAAALARQKMPPPPSAASATPSAAILVDGEENGYKNNLTEDPAASPPPPADDAPAEAHTRGRGAATPAVAAMPIHSSGTKNANFMRAEQHRQHKVLRVK